jgi:hypothetical protein
MPKEEIIKVDGPLSKASKPASGATRVVRVWAKVDGFRRAGIKHSAESVDHLASEISDTQYEQLAAEPKLVVLVVDKIGDEKPEKK